MKRFTKRKSATTTTDPAALAKQKLDARLHERAVRALRKRRRDKSHQ